MKLGCPKPKVREKSPRPLRRSPLRRAAIQRGSKRIAVGKTWRDPELLAQARRVRKRCSGLCEICGVRPMTGLPNHLGYGEQATPERRIVPDSWVVGSCHDCHVQFHKRFGYRKDLPVYRPGAADPVWPTMEAL